MAYYIDDYIRLCDVCAMDVATLWNMRNVVIPSLEREAQRYRDCIADRRPEDQAEAWDGIEADLQRLEVAIASVRKRCKREPQQQQLFAA